MTGLVHASDADFARPLAAGRSLDAAFVGLAALVFGTCAVLTTQWARAMSAMPGMTMPGGWTLSMTWIRMPGETWFGATTTFLEMWLVMMGVMMLPTLVPWLWRYRQALSPTNSVGRDWLTAVAGTGYVLVWTLIGGLVYPVGIMLTMIEVVRPDVARLVPMAAGGVVFGAGAIQLTAWKLRRLAHCFGHPDQGRVPPPDTHSAWRCGLRLGWRCVTSCANLMAITLAIGLMDLGSMTAIMAAIALERVAPPDRRIARLIGAPAVGLGLYLLARAASSLTALGATNIN